MVLNNNYFSREIVVQTIFYLAITAVLQAGNAQKRRCAAVAHLPYRINLFSKRQARKPRSTPAATADPITPATFGPMACISR